MSKKIGSKILWGKDSLIQDYTISLSINNDSTKNKKYYQKSSFLLSKIRPKLLVFSIDIFEMEVYMNDNIL